MTRQQLVNELEKARRLNEELTLRLERFQAVECERTTFFNQFRRSAGHFQPGVNLHTIVADHTKYAAILENIADACYVLDNEWRLAYANSAAEESALGLSKDCLGKSIWELFPRLVGDYWERALRKAVGSKLPVHALLQEVYSGRWFDSHFYPHGDLLIVCCQDVTEQKNADDKIKEQARLLDLARDYIIVRDTRDRIVFWNRGAESGYGWPEGDVLGRPAGSLLKTEYSGPDGEIAEALATAGYWEGELVHSRIDGTRIVVRSHQTLTRDADGKPTAVLEINHDITQQKQAEERLLESELRLRTCLDHMLDGIVIYRPVWDENDQPADFRIEFINSAGYREQKGKTREDFIGKRLREVWPGRADEYLAIYRQVMTTGRPYKNENEEWYDERSRRLTAVYETHIFKMGDGIASWRRNITEKRVIEADMARFDRLNVIGEMAASIGHEVRNPLTTVRGYLQLFQRKAKYADHRDQFQTMIEELDRANFIITEFLSLAKNKAVQFENGNLNDIIDVLLPLLQASALRTGHEIKVEKGGIPDIKLDKKEIRQLLLNLVRNALEAMPRHGTVIIKTWFTCGEIVLAVEDSGGGIPKDILDKLGTPFITTKDGGTGLGLPVCYRIAERHGAKLDFNTSAAGTVFLVRFKCGEAAKDA